MQRFPALASFLFLLLATRSAAGQESRPAPPGGGTPPPDEGVIGDLTPGDLEAYDELADLVLVPSEIGARRLGSIDPRPSSLFRLGGFRVFPVARQEVLWDTNVLLAEHDARSSRIDITNLGLFGRSEFWGGRGALDLGYLMSAHRAGISPRVYDDFTEHYGAAGLRLEGNDWYARGGFKVENRTQPVANQFSGAGFAQAERDLRSYYGQVATNLGDRLLVELGAEQRVTAHHDGFLAFLDGTRQEGALRVGLRGSAGSLAYVKAAAGSWSFDEGTAGGATAQLSDDDYVAAGVGFEAAVPESREWRVEVGGRRDEFDDDNTFGDDDDRHTDLFALVSWKTWVREDATFTASYFRTTAPATGSNFQMVDRADLAYEPMLAERVRGRAGTYFEHSRPSEQGESSRYGVGFGARYEISRAFDLGADFEYRRRIANDPGGDYVDRRFALGVALRF